MAFGKLYLPSDDSLMNDEFRDRKFPCVNIDSDMEDSAFRQRWLHLEDVDGGDSRRRLAACTLPSRSGVVNPVSDDREVSID